LGGLFGSSVGGGVYIPGSSSLTLANCTVSSNDGDEVLGGGIYSGPNSSSTIIGCQFLNNMAEGDGSAIFSIGSFLTIINSSFSGNKAYFGGGTVRGGGSLIVAGSTFTSNHVYGGGGAINGGGNMIVTDSIFIGNGAFRGSGAISYGGSIDSRGHISDCTFSENGGQEGGAIELWTDGFFLISNCTFTNNRTSLGGGALRVQRGQPRIANCIFSGNDSGDDRKLHIPRK
ncbi:MAG: right-handed parallel beta-helix repeat-containing protein, partial [bacterium]